MRGKLRQSSPLVRSGIVSGMGPFLTSHFVLLTSPLPKYATAGCPQLIDDFRRRVEHRPASDATLEWMPAISAYGLVLWALDGKNQSGGYGFPFDRPHVVFAQRLLSLYQNLQELTKLQLRGQWRDNRPLYKLSSELEAVFDDQILRQALTEIEPKIQRFDELREATIRRAQH